MQEEWKRLNYRGKDLGDFYLVSNLGEIKGVKTGKIRSKNINKSKGYYFVSISSGSRESKQTIEIHKAVADTFIGYKEDLVVNHMDGNKLNNNVDNLEYCTYSENTLHAIKIGIFDQKNKGKKIRNKNTNKIYDSITKAAKDINPEDSITIARNISAALHRKNKVSCGAFWEYTNSDGEL